MSAVYVIDRIAVTHYVAFEVPGRSQLLIQQEVTGTRRRTVDTVIGTHDGIRSALSQSRLECIQIGVVEVLVAYLCVEVMSRRFRAAVDGEVLRSGHRFEVMRIIPLHSLDERNPHPRGQVGIFTIGLLPAPPPGIAKDVNVRRPEGQAIVAAMII